MRRGLTLPIFDRLADPSLLADLAAEAEQAGWDGVFVWDHLRYRAPVQSATDPWIALAAMATRTDRVLLGPMVTPLARRRPQIVARQLVALDHLSSGRMVFGVGLGLDSSGGEFEPFGEPSDVKVRAEILDEGLELLGALLSGDEVAYRGDHLTAAGVRFLPTPVQPRLPIWVAARWPNPRPMRRAAGFDGVFVIEIEPPDLVAVIAMIEAARENGMGGYDVVVNDVAGADPQQWADAGATWLLTRFDQFAVDAAEVRTVISRGPATC
jgi:alkanesulfonate monooxygenase SsuD/methylene tetrahydromethanopterin reductase-like flavin-dependent oxidoreductase (luciferase family)